MDAITIFHNTIKYLNRAGYSIEDTLYDYETEGYFTRHFTLEGVKNWKFGILITNDKDSYNLSLFGEHIHYIDKFKPTQTAISHTLNDITEETFKVTKDNWLFGDYSPFTSWLFDFYWSILRLKNEYFGIWYYYADSVNVPPIKWMFSEWWFNNITHPIQEWRKHQGNLIQAKVYAFFFNLIKPGGMYATAKKLDFYFPTVELAFHYPENASDEFIEKWYFRLPHKSIGYNRDIEVEHLEFGNPRGFYIREE